MGNSEGGVDMYIGLDWIGRKVVLCWEALGNNE